ncbi:MAG: acetate--CoA ligase family protein [Burkholderiales bacterium]|nr:acetate--CoA ligase family protein [Burkholderiales bacterium]
MKHGFRPLFYPRSVAIVGASSNPGYSVGGQPLRSLATFGFKGAVHPVNPKYEVLNDLPCYPAVGKVPRPCDLALVAVAASRVPGVIRECGAAGIPFAVILSSGFREIGEAGATLQQQVAEAARQSGVRVIGPNCQGIMNLATRMFAGFGVAFQRPDLQSGPVAMVTQSGGFGYSLVTRASDVGIGFNYVVSIGNECDVSTLDLLEYLLELDEVEVLTAYIEGIKDGRRLLAIGERALALRKPILVWKVGNSDSGRRASASHTANLTSDATVYRAAFRQGGFIEIGEVHELIDFSRGFLSRKLPRGRNVTVITSSGGAGVLLADRCDEAGFRLPPPADATRGRLREFMPEFASVANPVDVTAELSGDPAALNRAVAAFLDDPATDQVIVYRGNVTGTIGRTWATGLGAVAAGSDKPILVSLLQEQSRDALQVFNEHRISWFPTPGRAAAAAAALMKFSDKLAHHARRAGRHVPRQEIGWGNASGTLGEFRSKRVLAAYGIRGVRETLHSPAELAALQESPLRFPLAVKIESPDIPHKSEAGAVRVGIGDLDASKKAAEEVLESVRRHAPAARIDGIILQEMAAGTEVIVGVVNDAYFGPVIVLGLGGIFAEVLGDVTHRCAPVDLHTARTMIRELKGHKVLLGARGRPEADLEALADTVSRLSWLAWDHADRIAEIDVNPLFVGPAGGGAVAADALIVLGKPALDAGGGSR